MAAEPLPAELRPAALPGRARGRRAIAPLLAAAAVAAAALGAAGCGGQGALRPSARPARRTQALLRVDFRAPRSDAGEPRVAFASVALTIPAANSGGTLTGDRALTLPRGWTAEVWARVPLARLEAWTPQGDLLVSSPYDGEVFELIPVPGRPAAVPREVTLLSGLMDPQGLAFARLHGQEVLYVAEGDEVDRYVWLAGTVGARTVVVGDLPALGPTGADFHPLKNLVVAPDGTVYVDIGSASNDSPPAPGNPPRASVIAFGPGGGDLRVFATGVRNGDGLAFAPDGTLWTAVNERDEITYPFHRAYDGIADAYNDFLPVYVNEHPPDELARLTPGRNLGWPYCDPDPDVHPGRLGSPQSFAEMPWDADAQANPDSRRLDCAKLPRIERGLPAHSAPLGFHFLEGSTMPAAWREGAVVAVHGSWDRTPPRAPAVLWLPWLAAQRTLGPAITLVGGFQSPDGTRWGRPVDAVAGPDGALYVSDDTAGAVYRIVPARGH
jgi:glucose/arabinose dehydrogenase